MRKGIPWIYWNWIEVNQVNYVVDAYQITIQIILNLYHRQTTGPQRNKEVSLESNSMIHWGWRQRFVQWPAQVMYQVVPGGAGGTITDVIPKQKHSRVTRPLVGAGVLGLVLVIAAVSAWSYYIASLRKAELLKTQLLDLNKDGYIIRNQGGAIVFRMDFRWVASDWLWIHATTILS